MEERAPSHNDDDGPSEHNIAATPGSSIERAAGEELIENGFFNLNSYHVSFVGEHIARIETFMEDIQHATNAAWPTRRESRYQEVHVLLLS